MKPIGDVSIFLIQFPDFTSLGLGEELVLSNILADTLVPTYFSLLLVVIGLLSISIALVLTILLKKKMLPYGDKTIHPEKAVIYKRFIDLWYEPSIQNEESLSELSKSMALWAGDDVLKQYILLDQEEQNSGSARNNLNAQIEKVILEMRRDLGQKNFGILSGHIDQMLTRKKSVDNQNN